MADCTQDVLEHKKLVAMRLVEIASELIARAVYHDDSKLHPPEKEMFDQWTPALDIAWNTAEYKQALEKMGEGLKHHYAANRHHPEFFENGVDGMNLVDIMEMVCDWQAAAYARRAKVDLEYAAVRFNLSPQLVQIIRNSLG